MLNIGDQITSKLLSLFTDMQLNLTKQSLTSKSASVLVSDLYRRRDEPLSITYETLVPDAFVGHQAWMIRRDWWPFSDFDFIIHAL